ncbi:hypothetical protein R3W88_005601 [Solanum pinnatisectum]|uniref:Factor of DNA methylation 1-5/IDN2 domain-containing protein n=1 Tax=Solanum pinnatisectum TaxID=50273 RepID=A0AAV9KDX7_9SOLN|nr:hypothetical protein R3W88_005601 [Solanum pinnatisectum]
METITTSENSNTHAYTRLDFLNRVCPRGLAVNSIGIKVEGLEKGNESLSSKMAELEKEIETALSKITHLEREGEAALRKIVAVKKKKQAALIKICKLEKEKECTVNKVALLEKEKERTVNKIALLEKEGNAAFCKIAMLEMEKQDTSSKIELLEKEKEDAAKKIAFLEKELETKEEKFGKYMNAQLQREEELRTKFEDFKKHTNAEHQIEKDAAMSKIAMLEMEQQAASSKIEELQKEKEDAAKKIAFFEKELETKEEKIGKYTNTQLQKEEELRTKFKNYKKHTNAEHKIEKDAAMSKIAMLETEQQAASSKIEELEKEKEDAAKKIAFFEKELETKEEKIGKYMNAPLQKEEELRTKFEDYKKHTNAEHKIEKDAAMSKIAMLEKELETKEIQVEDKEPKEKVKELTKTMQKLTEERQYGETLAKQLKGKESETTELVEARKKMISVLSELNYDDVDIGIKKFGAIDSCPFRTACKQKFSRQVAEEKATELCSVWQANVENPKWNPFKTVILTGEVQETIDQEDKHLQQLRKEWGYEVYLAVVIALEEIKEYNKKERTTTHQLWNFEEGRKAMLEEVICLMEEKLMEAKIKDTGFVKVDELKPGTEGVNLIVKVLNTDVVVEKSEEQQSLPSYHYSPFRITRVAESLVGDETGTIILTTRNEQVDLMTPGSILLLYGAKIQIYRGFLRLAVENKMQIKVAEPMEFDVDDDEDCNLSLAEYDAIRKY